MANGRCRMHGGTNRGAPKGERNGAYKHGRRTQEAEAQGAEARALLRGLMRLLAATED